MRILRTRDNSRAIYLYRGSTENTVLEITGGTIENTANNTAIYNNASGKIYIPSGTTVIKGAGKAMNKAPTLGTGMQVTASTNYSGSPSTSYNPDDIATYKYLKAEPAPAIPAPAVTGAQISISGATGTGGVYRAGNTVTVTWNNTASGDNNFDGINGVAVNFSEFGGGTAVSATNTAGTWTATYTIAAGSIESANRNVSVTVTDNAGNKTTTADNTNATVDNKVPAVTSVEVPENGTYSAGANLNFIVNFSENVNVGGTPALSLTVGSQERLADYAGGSGTSALLFRYTVQAGDSDGISVGSLTLNGSTIKDVAGNDARLTLNSVGSTSGVLINSAGAAITTPASLQSVSYNQITVNAAAASSNPGDQAIEYAISTSSSAAPTEGYTTDKLNFTGLSPSTTYYVWARTAAKTGYNAGTAVASAAITTAPQNPLPNAAIDYINEKLTGLVANGSYLVSSSEIVASADGKIEIETTWLGSVVGIRHKGNGNTIGDSLIQSLDIPARPAALTTDEYAVRHESVQGANDGAIRVNIAECEYSADNGTIWQAIAANTWLENLAPGNYLVRKKAVAGTSFKSNFVTVTINAGTPAPTYTITADPVTKDFGSLTVGYSAPAAQTVTITNTGNTSATLTQPTSTNYAIGALSDTTLAAGGTATFTVTPKTGLAVGAHNETLTVSTDHSTNATVQLSFSVTAVPTYTITFNPNGGTVSETSRSVAPGAAVGTLPTLTRSGSYRFDGWYTAASGGTKISASTTVSAEVTYYAHWTYTGGGSGGGSGSGGSGGSSNDNCSSVIVTPPAPDKPNTPTQGEIKAPVTADSKGNITVNITDKIVTDAFDKALADAKKNGNEQNGITVVLRADTGSKTRSNVTVNLPKTVQETIISKKIVNTVVVVNIGKPGKSLGRKAEGLRCFKAL